MGITIPDDIFSLKGIFNLVMQVLGLGWDYLRLKAVKMMGEKVVGTLEKGWDVFKIFATKGIDGIWEYLKDTFSDIKETVLDAIQGMLITQVIEAGIKWLLSLLMPGAGFIKAIMAIKDVIVFFVESAIMLIPAIIEAILALAAGSIAGVGKAIEKGLSMLLPLVINLFAKLIGLGGLAKRVMKIFKKIRKRIDKAVNKILMKAKKAGRKLMRKLGIGKKKDKKKKGDKDERSEKEMKADLKKGIKEATTFVKQGGHDKKEIKNKLDKIENKYDLVKLKLVVDKQNPDGKDKAHIEGEVNPKDKGDGIEVELDENKRVLATAENKKLALEKLKKVNLSDIDSLVDQTTLDRYKNGPGDSYVSYIKPRKETQEMDWPIKYLKRRSSLKQGKADESYWIEKQFGKSAKKNEKTYNVRHPNYKEEMVVTPVIPDYITGSEVGDVKNVAHQSYANQLRAVYQLSLNQNKKFSLITRTGTTFTGTFPLSMKKHKIITKEKK